MLQIDIQRELGLDFKGNKSTKKRPTCPKQEVQHWAGRRFSGHNGSKVVFKYWIYQKGNIVDWGSDLQRLRSQEGSREHFLEKGESFGKGSPRVKAE